MGREPHAAATADGAGAAARHLVISRVGRGSVHEGWLAPAAARDFDVLLSRYELEGAEPWPLAEGELRAVPGARTDGGCVFEEFRPGTNVAALSRVLREHAALVSRYRFVALFDDDVETDATGLSALFAAAESGGYRICQPALTHDSHYSYAGFLQQKAFALRHVNYVEIMCPVFRADVLVATRPLFELGLEVGIDLVWCNVADPSPGDHAVIDAVAVRHGRAIGLRKAENGFAGGRRYEDDIVATLQRFDLPWLPCLTYRGVRPDGTRVTGRLGLLLAALPVLGSVWRRRPFGPRLRYVLTHWKHLAFARPRNLDVRIDPSPELPHPRLETARSGR